MTQSIPSPLRQRLSALTHDRHGRLMWVTLALLLVIAIAVGTIHQSRRAADSGNHYAAAIPAGERARMEQVVHDYLLSHPEIIPEAVKRLQDRQVAELVQANRQDIETPFDGAWAGAKNGDVTLVEFFDYACPYCRASNNDVKRLLAEDPKLKVVWRDFPVLGPDSEQAAMASLSAARQNHFRTYYDTMFETGRPDRAQVIRAVRVAKMNEMQTAGDMDSQEFKNEIQKNLELGRALGLTGTPSYVIGDQILNGAVGYQALKDAIAKAREARRS